MFAQKTKTTETFILPEEFETYTQKGFTIFMTKPTMFGTYRAVKVEVIKHTEELPYMVYNAPSTKRANYSITRFISNLLTA